MWLLALLTLAGGALRFATLDVQSLWYDEAVTVKLIELSLPDMLERIPDSESTPPLYYLVAWLWSKPFGTGEVGLRSLSALAGTLAIPAFLLAARELTGSRRAALVVAALAAFNPLLAWYSQEARAYALVMLLGALALWCFARLLCAPDRRALAGWALASALALATHYFAIFAVAPMAAWLIVRSERRRPLLVAVGAVAAAALALLPIALHQQSLDLASFIRSVSLPYRVARTGKQLLVGFEAPLEIALSFVSAAIALAGIVVALRRPRPGVLAAAVVGVAALALPIVLALLDLDYFDTRNVIVAWLPLATVVAAGLAASRAGLAGAAVVCALGLVATISVALEPLWQRHDWRGVADSLGPPTRPRAVVLTPRETGEVPYELYRAGTRPIPAAGAQVSEVALVSMNRRTSKTTHPPPPPRPVAPTVDGFRELRRDYAESYSVIVFRAPAPRYVSATSLYHFRLQSRETAAILLER